MATLAVLTDKGERPGQARDEMVCWTSAHAPFQAQTCVPFENCGTAPTVFTVFDAAGREVHRERRPRARGRGMFVWDGTGPGGARRPAGVYRFTLRAGDRVGEGRVVLMNGS